MGEVKTELRFLADDHLVMINVAGKEDENLRFVEKSFNVRIFPRGNELVMVGNDEESLKKAGILFQEMMEIARKGHPISLKELKYSVKMLKQGRDLKLGELYDDVIHVTVRGKIIRPKTLGQKKYVEAVRENDITFAIGPAGTGKTYLAVALAVSYLQSRKVGRIILVRPAVEAGEKLGFLPGDLREKIEPYLRPLYDALYEMLEAERFHKLLESGTIEIAPLAYMRGRTLNDAFVILDEAQNATPEQMKMFLTRLGFGSKMVITGDITQIDLPGKRSGLVEVRDILIGIGGIAFVYLTEQDVVRHELVQRIVKAYEEYEMRRENESREKQRQ